MEKGGSGVARKLGRKGGSSTRWRAELRLHRTALASVCAAYSPAKDVQENVAAGHSVVHRQRVAIGMSSHAFGPSGTSYDNAFCSLRSRICA